MEARGSRIDHLQSFQAGEVLVGSSVCVNACPRKEEVAQGDCFFLDFVSVP